jgi:hypothetical protein
MVKMTPDKVKPSAGADMIVEGLPGKTIHFPLTVGGAG